MADEEKKQKKKLPTAQKRIIQDRKKQGNNRVLKSKIRTSIRVFDDHLKEKDQDSLTKDLNNIYALVDKAVKKNIYKVNKAKRIKSHYAKYMQKAVTA